MNSRDEANLKTYEVGPFVLEVGRERNLLRDGKPVAVKEKALRLLQLLVESAGKPVEREILLDELWPHQAVEPNNVDQLVSSLRKKMGAKPDGGQYIEAVPRVGFIFSAEVREKAVSGVPARPAPSKVEIDERQRVPDGDRNSGTLVSSPEGGHKSSYRRLDLSNPILASAVLGVLALAAILGVKTFSRGADVVRTFESARRVVSAPSDEDEVKRVVKESQLFETLSVYVNPNNFDESKLREYWLPAEQGGKAILQVEKQLASLRSKGRHFGAESELRQFDFRDVRVYAGRDYAEVRTDEKWYVPLYGADGSRVPDKNPILAYPVDYMLKKVNGKWLLEENGTPRPQEKK